MKEQDEMRKGVMMSRDEALRRAEVWAELGALRGVVVFILLFVVIIVLLIYRQYLYAVIVAALMVLAVFVMIKASKYAEVLVQFQSMKYSMFMNQYT